MSIEKTSAIVLSIIPWRETSLVVTIFSKEYGKISGIAKGIKRTKPAAVPLERGQIIDSVIYIKPTRSLQTLTDLQVIAFYPKIRENLEKTALRDIALELITKSIPDGEPHPELFIRTHEFFLHLEEVQKRSANFILLWRYVLDIAKHLGFGMNITKCQICNRSEHLQESGGFLALDRGGIICSLCATTLSLQHYFIGPTVLSNLNNIEFSKLNSSTSEYIRLTKLLISYCRFHMDIRQDFKSVEFVEQTLI